MGRCPNKNSFERSLKRFQTSEKGFGQQPVNPYLATVIDPVDVYLKLHEAVDYKQKPLSQVLKGLYKFSQDPVFSIQHHFA